MTSTTLNRVLDRQPVTEGQQWTNGEARFVVTGSQRNRTVQPSAASRFSVSTLVLLLAVLVVVAALVAMQPWKRLARATELVSETATIKTVQVARPSQAATASVVLPATIRPWQTTTLHARVSGYLTAWHRDLGATVEAGELLAEIETPELDQELSEGIALAAEAHAAAVQAKAERVEARADLRVAEAQLVRIQAEAELAKTQLARREKLLATRAISQDDYDTFVTQVQARTAEVAAAKADVAHRRTSLDTRAAVIEAREATARSRQANVDRLQELQAFKRIVAPFAGVVTQRTAEVGMLVSAGKESLFTIEDMSRVRVQMNVPQTYAPQTIPGVAAIVALPESSVAPVEAKITRVAESVDSASRTMLAEIELQNGTHHFQPGSYAQVSLTTAANSTVWTIPANTVSMRVAGPHVALVNTSNRIEIKPVTLGRDLGTRVMVTAGVAGDERLVVNPGDDLVEGLSIQVGVQGTQAVAQR